MRLPGIGLNEDLDNTGVSLVKLLVELGEILNWHSVSDQRSNIKLLGHDVIVENLLPVKVDGGLSISDESHTLLHERTNVEVVGVSSVGTDEADSTELLGQEDHFVGGLTDIGLEHQSLFDLVQEGLGLVERGRVDTGYSQRVL